MNHQPYLDWIFEDDRLLSAQQTMALHEHLETCENCRTLAGSFKDLETALNKSELLSPEPGFSTRWQVRLQDNRNRAHRRQLITLLSLVLGGLFLLGGALVWMAWPWLRSPNLLFWTWIYQLFTIYTYADALQDLASPILNLSGGIFPWIAWVFSLGLLSELAVLWVVSFRLLTNPRRITQ
jgi:hypothetical protein